MDYLFAIPVGVAAIGQELAELMRLHGQSLTPYLFVIAVIHITAQYALPNLIPGIYDALGYKSGDKDRAKLAADARSKIIATLFASYVTALSVYGLTSPDSTRLQHDAYASTELSNHLERTAIAYFIWDVIVCYLDGYSVVWWIHAICALMVYAASLVGNVILRRRTEFAPSRAGVTLRRLADLIEHLPVLTGTSLRMLTPVQRPFLHYMGMITLIYEASTPFLHVRKAMIQAGVASGPLYQFVQIGFASIFFATRIVFGLYVCWAPGQWNDQMQDLLATGKAHNPAIVRMYQLNCVILSLLNCKWMWDIVGAALKPTPAQKKSKSQSDDVPAKKRS